MDSRALSESEADVSEEVAKTLVFWGALALWALARKMKGIVK